MRILIVGSDVNTYSIAKRLKDIEGIDLIFAAPGNDEIKDFATSIDIQEKNADELLEFALANEINLTIVASETAISASIANLFKENNLNIFAPALDSARLCLSRSSAKKALYKLKVPAPKFGIFDKENFAVDYARKSKYPLLISDDLSLNSNKTAVCETFSRAKEAIETLFLEGSKKIIVENCTRGKKLSLYLITDGYTALPLGCVDSNEIMIENKDTKICLKISTTPDSFVSYDLLGKIMKTAIYPLLDEISGFAEPYCGILRVDFSATTTGFQVINFSSVFKSVDLQSILPLIKDNLKDLFFAATNGSLSDDYADIKISSKHVFSIGLKGKNSILKDSDLEDFICAYSNNYAVITSLASTFNTAKTNLLDCLYSTDILTPENADAFEEVTFYE